MRIVDTLGKSPNCKCSAVSPLFGLYISDENSTHYPYTRTPKDEKAGKEDQPTRIIKLLTQSIIFEFARF